jgi:hypothetical protein
MKLKLTFEFEFAKGLTDEETTNLIHLIEGWAEYESGAFLEIPSEAVASIDIGYDFVADKNNNK